MNAVPLSESQVEPHLVKIRDQPGLGHIAVGYSNSPVNLTISGDERAVAALETLLKDDGISARRLQVDVAYHSEQKSQVAADYAELIRELRPLKASRSKVYAHMFPLVSRGTVSPLELLQKE